jgi:L-ascorbate metabolism protein UlaG (beta-lactamase superfamily)
MSADVLRRRFDYARRYARSALREGRRSRIPIAPAPHRPDPAAWSGERLAASWLGHATVLLDLWGTRALTDPALERRIGIGRGVAKLGPRRLIEPALRPRDLDRLELVLLSHAHMDHTDLGTLAALPRRVPVVVQRGNRDLVRRFRQVHELGWGESAEVDGVEVTSVEVRHWGARMVTDHHRGYGGFLLAKGGRRVLFAGDTAYTDAFRRLPPGGPIDLAIMPIGAYDPWVANHATPEQAWRMFQDTGADFLLPIHHSTFRLSREPVDEPIRRLLEVAGPERWRVALTQVGESWAAPVSP